MSGPCEVPEASPMPVLASLAARINREHAGVVEGLRQGLTHALQCGHLLTEARTELEHGEWMAWVEEHCEFKYRTAKNYLDLWERREELGLGSNLQRVADLSYREALKLLSAPKGGDPFVTHWSGSAEWYTPPEIIEAARMVMGGIDLDPATCDLAQETIGAAEYFTAEDSGLSREWSGRTWLNPPFSDPDPFIDKLLAGHASGEIPEAVLLTSNCTDTAWWHRALSRCSAICFTRGRIHFYNSGGVHRSPTNGQSLFYFGKDPGRFEEEFSQHGSVVIIGRTAGEPKV